jgi:hypothetical protein
MRCHRSSSPSAGLVLYVGARDRKCGAQYTWKRLTIPSSGPAFGRPLMSNVRSQNRISLHLLSTPGFTSRATSPSASSIQIMREALHLAHTVSMIRFE